MSVGMFIFCCLWILTSAASVRALPRGTFVTGEKCSRGYGCSFNLSEACELYGSDAYLVTFDQKKAIEVKFVCGSNTITIYIKKHALVHTLAPWTCEAIELDKDSEFCFEPRSHHTTFDIEVLSLTMAAGSQIAISNSSKALGLYGHMTMDKNSELYIDDYEHNRRPVIYDGVIIVLRHAAQLRLIGAATTIGFGLISLEEYSRMTINFTCLDTYHLKQLKTGKGSSLTIKLDLPNSCGVKWVSLPKPDLGRINVPEEYVNCNLTFTPESAGAWINQTKPNLKLITGSKQTTDYNYTCSKGSKSTTLPATIPKGSRSTPLPATTSKGSSSKPPSTNKPNLLVIILPCCAGAAALLSIAIGVVVWRKRSKGRRQRQRRRTNSPRVRISTVQKMPSTVHRSVRATQRLESLESSSIPESAGRGLSATR